jgi:DNA-binding NarL/FixJ family response regulator
MATRSLGPYPITREEGIAGTSRDGAAGPARAARNGALRAARIVLVDDDWSLLSRLRETIEQDPDLLVMAACRCADGVMAAVRQYRPAAVILDVRLPGSDGIELIRAIAAISRTKVIVFTAALPEKEIARALQSGAEAIVFKDQPTSMLVSHLRKVLAGEACMPRQIAIRGRLGAEDCVIARPLSAREREVAQLAAAGARNKQIAWRLGISEGTVKLHLVHAYQKLNVGNRVGLVLALRRVTSNTLAGITFVSLTFVQ